MKQEFDNNYNGNNTYNNSVTPNLYSNAYGNNGAPNPYANNGVPNQNNNYSNPVMPNQNNNFYNNYNNTGMPNQYNNVMPNQYNAGPAQWQSPKKEKKTAVIIFLAVLIPVIAFLGIMGLIFGIVFGVLNHVKDTEEYDLAYSYFVNSETFEELDAEESDIKLTGYSSITDHTSANSHSSRTEFKFMVKWRTFVVVCHEDVSEESFVCVECTDFD